MYIDSDLRGFRDLNSKSSIANKLTWELILISRWSIINLNINRFCLLSGKLYTVTQNVPSVTTHHAPNKTPRLVSDYIDVFH